MQCAVAVLRGEKFINPQFDSFDSIYCPFLIIEKNVQIDGKSSRSLTMIDDKAVKP